jgi:rubrerythrin
MTLGGRSFTARAGVSSLAGTHPALSQELVDEEVSADAVSPGSKRRVLWRCSTCRHEWIAAIIQRTANHTGCPTCAGKVATPERNLAVLYPQLAAEWADEQRSPLSTTGSSGYRALWACSVCGYRWLARVVERVRGSGCPECDRRARPGRQKSTMGIDVTHPTLAAEWAETGRGPEAVTAGSHRKVRWRCRTCGHLWTARVYNRTRGSGCPA